MCMSHTKPPIVCYLNAGFGHGIGSGCCCDSAGRTEGLEQSLGKRLGTSVGSSLLYRSPDDLGRGEGLFDIPLVVSAQHCSFKRPGLTLSNLSRRTSGKRISHFLTVSPLTQACYASENIGTVTIIWQNQPTDHLHPPMRRLHTFQCKLVKR